MAFDEEMEADVLAESLRDSAFLRQALPVLNQHNFSDKYLSWIWKVTSDSFAKTGEIPTPVHYGQWIKRDFKNQGEQTYTVQALIGIRRRKPPAPRTGLEAIRNFVRMAAIREGGADSFDHLDKGDLDAAEAAQIQAIQRVQAARMLERPEPIGVNWKGRLSTYADPSAVSADRVPTPFPSLTRFIGGGLAPKALGLMIAFLNTGKSSLSVDFGYMGLISDPNVIVADFCTEESKEEREARYDARISGIDRQTLTTGAMSLDEMDQFRDRFERAGDILNRLIVQQIPVHSPVSAVAAFLHQVRADHPGKKIHVIGDSLDHLLPVNRVSNERIGFGNVYYSVKSYLSEDYLQPISGWFTTQATVESAKRNQIKPWSASETIEKMRVASVGIGIMEGDGFDKDSPIRNMRVPILRNRQGKIKHWWIYVDANLGTSEWIETANMSDEETMV